MSHPNATEPSGPALPARTHHAGAYVVPPGAGRTLPVPFAHATVTLKAESHHTGGAITIFESTHAPHSVGPARHYHDRLTEVFYILDGRMHFLIGEERHLVDAGTTVVIPPGTVHAFRNGQRAAARLLVLVVPGGFEGFFDAAQGLQSPMHAADHWERINERWDTHVVGPPLEREADEGDG